MDVGYMRVSTNKQDHALQLDALMKAGCKRVFEDTISGGADSRPELQAALSFVRAGDTLVCWRLDRLGRSLAHLISTVKQLEARGVGFRSVTEAIDTTSPGGRLVFHIFGALAEFELGLLRERTRAGLDAARARGRVGGRPPKMNEESLRRARKLLEDEKNSMREISALLGVSRGTLYRHLGAEKQPPIPGIRKESESGNSKRIGAEKQV